MNIVIFSQIFFPENASINATSQLMRQAGHDVTVMAGIPNAPKGRIYDGFGYFRKLRENWNGIDVVRNWLIPRRSGSGVALSLYFLSYVVGASLGIFRLRGKKPDVIFVNQVTPVTIALPAILYKKITGRPLAMWIHDLWPESVAAAGAISNPRVLGWIGVMVKFIYRHCDLIYAQSHAMAEILKQRGVPPEKILYLPNPVEDFFKPLPQGQRPAEMENVPKGFIVMFAGSIGSFHDMETIVAAAKILKNQTDISFVIVGDGKGKAVAEALAVAEGVADKVLFLGQFPPARMPEFFAAADSMLVTLQDQPIFAVTVPLKTHTYLACGRPILCTVRGATAQIVAEAEAGLSSMPEDAAALAANVVKMKALSQVERNQMGRNARQYFENHLSNDIIRQTLDRSLRKLASGTRPS
jgi:colanic acid biosynthesis glycosyl transferase WcaI